MTTPDVKEMAELIEWANDSRYSNEAVGIAFRARLDRLSTQAQGEQRRMDQTRPHSLSDLEFTELIRTWRSNGFEFAAQIVREFPEVDGKTILLALNDARSMLPPLPSKGN